MSRLLPLLVAAVTALPLTARAQCSNLPAGCPTCEQCTFPSAAGTQPASAVIHGYLEQLAQNALGAAAPTLRQQEQGAARTSGDARFPCVLFKAISAVESSWRQFCSSGRTVISFDCGYGISQITSSAATYTARIASEPAWNIGAGADILLTKWNAQTTYGGAINDSTPTVVENWYYATWAYNGFTNSNNPNNPSLPSPRPPYGGPGSLTRGSYPYQEIVWGRIRYPLQEGGNNAYDPVDVTYPDLSTIPPPPSSGSLFEQNITINPQHDNPCVDPCAAGCPDPRELIVDNDDPGFSITGSASWADTGGYHDTFLYAPASAVGSPAVTATFTPSLPSDGVWEIAGWIPLDPATSDAIPVVATAVGADMVLSMDQTVRGGVWQVLGQAKLRAGHTSVIVRNDSGDTGHDVGFDAIRWRWVRFGGAAGDGEACVDSTECRDSLMCASGTCRAPCWEAPCAGGGTCDAVHGACGPPPLSSSGSGQPGTSSGTAVSAATSGQVAASTTDDGPRAGSISLPACNDASAGGGGPGWGALLALAVVRARRRR